MTDPVGEQGAPKRWTPEDIAHCDALYDQGTDERCSVEDRHAFLAGIGINWPMIRDSLNASDSSELL